VACLVLWLAPSPWPQIVGLPLLLAALFWALVPQPAWLATARAAVARRPITRWGLPLLALAALVCLVYLPLLRGHMPWAAGEADHPTHLYQAWLLVERMLPTGRLAGWSDLRWAGYPALELYPIGGPLWVALWRALTLGLLDWEATYALALLAMIAANVAATYVAARRLSGPGAALVAALLVLFERGWPRQGGDHYAVDVGVWPVTMGIGPLLLCLERQWSWLAGRGGGRAIAAACLLAGWALLCHPMYLPVLLLAAPCVLAVALVRRVPSNRAALGAAAPFLVGLMLAGFWYGPFFAHRAFSEPGGAPFRSLTNIGEGLAMATFLPQFWTPALVAGLLGLALALARGGGVAALAALALALVLASSSTPLELSDALTALSGSVQQERFMIPLRVLLCVLAGHAVAEAARLALARTITVGWGPRQRIAAVALVLAAAPLAAPAAEAALKQLVVPVLEFEHGPDLQHRRDLLALCRWLRAEAARDGRGVAPPRTAWQVGYGHNEYASAPVYCGLAQVVDTPAETFVVRAGGISEREARAFGVRWVVSDHPLEGREGYLSPVRSFGALRVYEVSGADPAARLTVLGPGRARIERFEDELIRVRVEGAEPGTRVALHVTAYPGWEATVNGRPVEVSRGHLGLPRASLIHAPVADGVLELRYRRGWASLGGALATLFGALVVGLMGGLAGAPGARLERLLRRRRVVGWILRAPGPAQAAAVCGLGALVLAAALSIGHGNVRPVPPETPPRPWLDPAATMLADLLRDAEVWVVPLGEDAPGGERGGRRRLQRRWDGRFGGHLPPLIAVDRHVEALALGDPRRVVAVRVADDEEVHVRFPLPDGGARGLRGAFARGGRGQALNAVAVWLGHRRIGRFTQDRLGTWREIAAIADQPARPLELVVRGSGGAGRGADRQGRAVLIDAALVP
jgi:hypothetical protein